MPVVHKKNPNDVPMPEIYITDNGNGRPIAANPVIHAKVVNGEFNYKPASLEDIKPQEKAKPKAKRTVKEDPKPAGDPVESKLGDNPAP